MTMDLLLATAFFLFGLTFGSFLNVCIHRIPRELSVVWPGSACPQCRRTIKAYDNIPVLSWLILRGRCRNCQAPISPRYAVVELLTAILFLECYVQFGLTILAFKYCVFSFLIVGLIFMDAEWKLLPDGFTLPGLVLGLGFSLLVPLNDVLTQVAPALLGAGRILWRWLSLADSAFGATIGASFFYGIAMLYLHARGREGMGLGDVKLMAMVGAFLGVRLTVLTIFGASLVGSLFGLATIMTVWTKRTRRRMTRNHEPARVARRRAWRSARTVYSYYEMPFGVFLGAMAIVSLFFGLRLLQWYWSAYL